MDTEQSPPTQPRRVQSVDVSGDGRVEPEGEGGTLGLRRILSDRSPGPGRRLPKPAQRAGQRRLSLSEVWASLDPIILAVTQPVNVKVEDVQLVGLTTNTIDLSDLRGARMGVDLFARTRITLPSMLNVNIEVPPLALDLHSGTLGDMMAGDKSGHMHMPFASVSLPGFSFLSSNQSTAETIIHIDMLDVSGRMIEKKTQLIGLNAGRRSVPVR
jgi:hypothetical protein